MRQISESIEIKLRSKAGVHLLNSKTEYNRCLLPELSVQVGQNKQTEVVAGPSSEDEKYLDAGRKREEDTAGGNNDKKTNIMMEPDAKKRRRWKQAEQLKRMEEDMVVRDSKRRKEERPVLRPIQDLKIRGLVPQQNTKKIIK